MIEFIAEDLTILKLSEQPNEYDVIMSPDCVVKLPTYPMDVTYNYDETQVVGKATVTRKGNKLVATLRIQSQMKNAAEAMRLIKQLVPVMEARILDAVDNKVLWMEVTSISLIADDESDLLPIGNKLQCANEDTKRKLH